MVPLFAESDATAGVVAGVIFGVFLALKTLYDEWREGHRSRRKKEQEQRLVGAAESITKQASTMIRQGDKVTEQAAKIEEVVNGKGIMGALKRIMGWQAKHEQVDEIRHRETTDEMQEIRRDVQNVRRQIEGNDPGDTPNRG